MVWPPVFVQGNIRELFGNEESVSTTAEVSPEVAEVSKGEEAMEESDKSIEQMLAEVEDESDVKAASRAKQEQVAELAEFDEGFMDAAGPLGKVRCLLVCVCVRMSVVQLRIHSIPLCLPAATIVSGSWGEQGSLRVGSTGGASERQGALHTCRSVS